MPRHVTHPTDPDLPRPPLPHGPGWTPEPEPRPDIQPDPLPDPDPMPDPGIIPVQDPELPRPGEIVPPIHSAAVTAQAVRFRQI